MLLFVNSFNSYIHLFDRDLVSILILRGVRICIEKNLYKERESKKIIEKKRHLFLINNK